jgi:hypothetical protein
MHSSGPTDLPGQSGQGSTRDAGESDKQGGVGVRGPEAGGSCKHAT